MSTTQDSDVREALRVAHDNFMSAYREKYARPSTGGVRDNAPLRHEVAQLNYAISVALSTPAPAATTQPASAPAREGAPMSGQAARCRKVADEVWSALLWLNRGHGWDEEQLSDVQSKLLPDVYDLLNLLAIAATPAPAAPEQAEEEDDVLQALELSPETFRTEGGSINKGKLRAAILHPYNYLPPDHWLQARFSKPGGRPSEQKAEAASPVGVAERLEDFRKRHWMHWADSRDNELVCEAIAELGRFYGALAWALGTNGTFKPQGTMDGKYWWRSELAERAGLKWDGARYATEPTQAREPDMRAVCEALGFDPTNHHNAAKCPYCQAASTSPKGST